MIKLRPYQETTVAKTIEGFKEFDRQIVVLPTGAGKTACATQISLRMGLSTLFLIHRKELADQALNAFKKFNGVDAQLEMGDARATVGDDLFGEAKKAVVVSSVQTLARRENRWPRDYFGLIIADECHHSVSDTWKARLDYFQGKVLGITATADRADKRGLGEAGFQNIAHSVSMLELIKQGYLAKVVLQTVPIQIDLREVEIKRGDYDENALDRAIRPYLGQIARALKQHAGDRRILAFLPLCATSEAFRDKCIEAGMTAMHIEGESPDRKQILKDFSERKFQVLSNAMLLLEGYDDPGIDCVVMLRPTKSRPLYAQAIGRGTRPLPEKKNLLVLDFLWLCDKHKLVKAPSLFGKETAVEQKMEEIAEDGTLWGLEDLMTVAENSVLAQREDALKKALEANKHRKGRLVDAMEFAVGLHDTELTEWQPVMPWHESAITDKQKATLEKFGIDSGGVTTKGLASALLDKIFTRMNLKLATAKQVQFLRRNGHPTPETCSFEDASKFIQGCMDRWKGGR